MKKWIGWIGFFLVIIGLIVGGIFLTSHFKGETFRFKEIEILDYNDFTLMILESKILFAIAKDANLEIKILFIQLVM